MPGVFAILALEVYQLNGAIIEQSAGWPGLS
jgi:hypothetical protein